MALIDSKSTQKFSYGLFVLTAKTNKDSGCIINTAIQVTSEPYKVSIAVNKNNYTLEMILESKKFNISILSESATFDIFTRFGFQSGRNVDKFDGFDAPTSTNGIKYIGSDKANAFISCEVENTLDLGTHLLIIANVTEAQILSDVPSATYAYYFKNIKPKPQTAPAGKVYTCQLCGYEYDESKEKVPFDKLESDWACPLCCSEKSVFKAQEKAPEVKKAKVYVCSICGYKYDESKEKVPFDELPSDWVCPLCKHPKSDFELLV